MCEIVGEGLVETGIGYRFRDVAFPFRYLHFTCMQY